MEIFPRGYGKTTAAQIANEALRVLGRDDSGVRGAYRASGPPPYFYAQIGQRLLWDFLRTASALQEAKR